MKKYGFSLIAVMFLLTGCPESATYHDYYSQVEGACNYLPTTEERLTASKQLTTFLHPKCKEVLQAALPLDDSFNNQDPLIKDIVTEAFQILVGAPLAIPPKNSILGVPNLFPIEFTEYLQMEETPNQSLFNYVANQFDTITYQESDPENPNTLAAYEANRVVGEDTNRTLIIYRGFVAQPTPYIQAGLLVHEARHGDQIHHDSTCKFKTNGDRYSFPCDSLDEAYGFQIAYYESVMHGTLPLALSGQASPSSFSSSAPFFQGDIQLLGLEICYILKYKIKNKPEELQSFIQGLSCDTQTITFEWVLEREGFLQ